VGDELSRARLRWPDAPEFDASLDAYLAERAPVTFVEDVVLAWWTGRDPRGIAAFEAAHAEVIGKLLQRFHRLDPDELRQQLRVKLFTGAAPKIRDYTGVGRLENWLKIVASRTFVDAARAQGPAGDPLEEYEAPGASPSDAAARAELAAVLKAALEAAILELPGRERTFLRHVVVDGLTLDQIAATYGVHRVTVARALGVARQRLAEVTRARVLEKMSTPLDLLDSQLHLSLDRLFPEPTL
jgi:RNA polymerase sigma-70 factor